MLGVLTAPWWNSSLVWDAVTTGGAGMTAPVFFGLGSTDTAVDKSDSKGLLLASALLIGGSVIGGLLGYGLYGHLRDKGWGPWKAGAMTGFLGGAATAGVLVAASLLSGRPLIPPLNEKNLEE